MAALVARGREGARMSRRGQQRRAKPYRFQPGRRVAIPTPPGGTRPLGSAPVEERGGQTAMQLLLAPLCAAACHDCSSGSRPKRGAQAASGASREERYQPAWGVVEIDCRRYCTTSPHDQLLLLSRQRGSDGRRRWRIKQRLKVGVV